MSFLEMQKKGPPAAEQVEVCVFGPNYGECILVHLGNNHWVVVDSCAYGSEPVAIAYLKAIGVDPATAIKAVVVTHWHDDHCKGISAVLAAAPDATVWIPRALTELEFSKFVSRMKRVRTAVAGNKLREFSAVIEDIKARKIAGKVNYGFSGVRTLIYDVPGANSGHGQPCSISALSPSQADELQFLTRIGQELPQARRTKRSVPDFDPNEVSVVTLVTIGDIAILLGADMVNSGKPDQGWEGILANHNARAFGGRASLYKIAHHGSHTGHNPSVWQTLLIPNVQAALTPWRLGGGRVPTKAEATAIIRVTKNAYASALDSRSSRKKKPRPPAVTSQLRLGNARMRSLEAPFGAVRFRLNNPGHGPVWQPELFGAALKLHQYRRSKAVP